MIGFGNALKYLLLLGVLSKHSTSGFASISLQTQIKSKEQHHGLLALKDDNSLMTARQARIMSPMMAAMMAFTNMVPNNNGWAAIAAEDIGELEDASKTLSSAKFQGAVKKYFPGAQSSSEVTLRLARALRERGYNERNTLLGASLCSDEINDTPVSLVNGLQSKLLDTRDGGVFNLGGLGGLPFVGTSGFGAFTSHCPESGKVVIVFGPHIGISNEGVIGKVERVGKDAPSTSCGAAVGAYKAIASGNIPPMNGVPGTDDFQEEFIIANLKNRLNNLEELSKIGDDASLAAITNEMYDLIWQIMKGEVEAFSTKPGFWNQITEVTLLGGIVINRGHGENLEGGDDLFQPLLLTTVAKTGESNIYQQVYGDLPTPRQRVLAGFNPVTISTDIPPPPEILVENRIKKKVTPSAPVAPAPVSKATAPVAKAKAPVAKAPAVKAKAPVAKAQVAKVPLTDSILSRFNAASTTTGDSSTSFSATDIAIPAFIGAAGAAVVLATVSNNSISNSNEPTSRSIPTITEWKKNRNGSVTGFIYGGSSYEDGDDITTSPLTENPKGDGIVTTKSGSRYYLEKKPKDKNKPRTSGSQSTIAVTGRRPSGRGSGGRLDKLERKLQNIERNIN
uniref:Limiting CO2-inducible protein B/C beta carbonyic anhydrase domain-containing protein n=1 Tax=Eucampia antarctica TaxID=49252 RepID=A0A7S2VZD4_9STRA|mmetsp:Transcript_13698/g.13269  ORF Transcript_13698/g.13269 Transcript_13698/m.13269 type:complete len:621 (+) Transcript_13698:162-2024(+)